LAGDGQSLGVDFDIRQSGRDQVSSVLLYDKKTSQPGLKGILNEITKENTVHLGIDVSRGPFTDNQSFQQAASLISNTLTPLAPGSTYATGSCSTPLTTTLTRCQRDTKDGEANRIAGMSRGQLEQYLRSRQLPTSGTIQQLRERALLRLEEGTPEQIPKQSREQLQTRNGKRW
jgi:hypothetical protein